MKNRNEKPREVLNYGSLCPSGYWNQLSNKSRD